MSTPGQDINTPASANRLRLFLGGLWPRISILHRYISRELLVVAVLTASVLTSLMALCGLLKPLRQHAVSTTELLEILLLLFPVFLAFTVPFAVMLACCWVYGRLASDNELAACSSSGINVQNLLTVPLVLGFLAMILNILLANWIVPNWALSRFESVLGRHGKDIVYRELRRRGSFDLSPRQIGRRCVIHADSIRTDIDTDVDELYGVAVAVFAKDSEQIEQIITAEYATLEFFPSAKGGGLPDSVAIVPRQATVVELPDYTTSRAAKLVFSGRIKQRVRQRLGSMSFGDLRAMNKDPELFNSIRDSAQRARRIYIAANLVSRLHSELAQNGYFQLDGPEHTYRFSGAPAEPLFSQQGAKHFLQKATVKQYDPGQEQPSRVFLNVDQVSLEMVELPASRKLTASMVLRDARISSPQASGPIEQFERSRFSITELTIPSDIVNKGLNLSFDRIKRGKFTPPVPPPLNELVRRISQQQSTLSKKLTLEIHSRFALAVSCPVLAVLGALLGAIFRRGQFLVAVGLSIAPAVVAMLFIVAGKKMADSPAFSAETAVAVIWSGLLLLALANLLLTTKVLRR